MLRKSFVLTIAIITLVACSGICTLGAVAEPFDLGRVRILTGIFKDAQDRDAAYLLALQPDRFLHMFRVTAGLPSSSQAYGGWESPTSELRGHTGGHYLSACAMMYASTGNSEFKNRADYLVAEFAKCQAAMPAMGYNQGYLSAFPESFIDRVEAQQAVWAPYYTLHKIMAGLYDAYRYCGNQQALGVLSNMAAWCKTRCDALTETQMQGMLGNEFGGMGEVLADLYGVTGNPDHLAVAQRFDKKWFTNALAQGTDVLPGIHSNTHIPQVTAAARLYELTGQARYQSIANNFWHICTSAHCYPTGGTSNGEYWHAPNTLSKEFGDASQETCCTYNMLKLANHLLAWTGDAGVGDYCENALLNHILTAQYAGEEVPQYAGMNSYYTSFVGGRWKRFHYPDNSMWCCTGTGFESHARYGDSIYFHKDNTLWVNLFIASELNWSEKGVVVRQDTLYPQEQTTSLLLNMDDPISLVLKIRVPKWAANGVSVTLNGQPYPVSATPGSFMEINRMWNPGDRVRITFSMRLRLERFADDQTIAAVFYGPVMLSGALGTANFTPIMQWSGGFSDISVPRMASSGEELEDWITPVSGQPLTFSAQGISGPITLIPFYKLFDQRYNLFWKVPVGPPDVPISGLLGQPDGVPVSFNSKQVTFAPRGQLGQRSTRYFYIADPNRVAAIRVEGPSVGFDGVRVGDYTTVSGALATKPTGERFIELSAAPVPTSDVPLSPLGMNTRTVLRDANAVAKLVTVAGKVTSVAAGGLSFTISDGHVLFGSSVALNVRVESGVPVTNIERGHVIVATGVISEEGGSPESAVRVLLLQKLVRVFPRDLALLAHYQFEETSGTSAADSSGNGWNATLVNGPIWTTGRFGNAVNLDGTNDHLTLPLGIVSGLENFTVAAWVKLDTNNAWNRIFDFGTGTGVNMFLTPRSSAGTLRYAITVSGSGGEQQINASPALPTGTWQHVAVTLAGSTGTLYVNGVKVGQNTYMTLKPSNLGATNRNFIGRSQYSDPYFDGLVDDFRIYGEALTSQEIAQLYNGF